MYFLTLFGVMRYFSVENKQAQHANLRAELQFILAFYTYVSQM
jgi:hypothetical protein